MTARRAFTLIEVMVVLSILAVIAVLAYNFFGSTMQEARVKQQVAKIYADFRMLSEADEVYWMKQAAELADVTGAPLVSTGIIKALPAPAWGAYTHVTYPRVTHRFSYNYAAWDGVGSAANDDYLWFRYVDDDVCAAYNEAYAPSVGKVVRSCGSNGWKNHGEPTVCCTDTPSGTPGDNSVYFLHRPH